MIFNKVRQSSKCKYEANLSLIVVFGSKYKNFEPFFINTKDLLNCISHTQIP